MKTVTHKITDTAYALQIGQTTYSLSTGYHTGGDATLFDAARNPNWEYAYQTVAGKRIVSYGPGNDLPVMVRDLVQDNNLAPGILQRQKGLLYGQGAFLYRHVIADGKITRQYDDDRQITEWLRSWDAKRFIEKALVDYLHVQGFFALHILERGQRLGTWLGRKPRIAKLQFVRATNARLEWAESRQLEDVQHIFVGDFENRCLTSGVQTYPVYDPFDPGRYPVSASYNYSYSFGRGFYSTPAFMGAIRWILRGSDIPTIFRYVTDNGLLDLSLEELIAADAELTLYTETHDRHHVDELVAILYRRTGPMQPSGRLAEAYRPERTARMARLVRFVPEWKKQLILLWYAACIDNLQRGIFTVCGREVSFAPLFSNTETSGKSLGWLGIQFDLAEKRTFGDMEQTGKTNIVDVLTLLLNYKYTSDHAKKADKSD